MAGDASQRHRPLFCSVIDFVVSFFSEQDRKIISASIEDAVNMYGIFGEVVEDHVAPTHQIPIYDVRPGEGQRGAGFRKLSQGEDSCLDPGYQAAGCSFVVELECDVVTGFGEIPPGFRRENDFI